MHVAQAHLLALVPDGLGDHRGIIHRGGVRHGEHGSEPAARGGALAVTFVDDSTFTVGENARMVLDELVYDPGTKTGTSAFSVVQGVFSFVSGQIAKTGSDSMQVRTPVATIGIRGTEVAIQAAAEGENNVITLLQEQGGNA